MKRQLSLAVALGSVSLFALHAYSADADNAAYREGYGLVLEQKWDEARTYFERFQTEHGDSAWADDAAFWRCYAIEQAGTQEADHFTCYESFVDTWPDSSWAADARAKLLVLGSRLASRGNPQYIQRIRLRRGDDVDLEFDFDGDSIADTVAAAMDRAQQELERVRITRGTFDIPEIPDIPDISEVVDVDEIRRVVRDIEVRTEQVQRNLQRRTRSSADDELLTVLAALRDNERASEILIDRFDQSDDPELRARIVLLLEDFRGEQITNKLVDIIENDADEEVRNNAIVVLLDHNDPGSRELLRDIATNNSYPVNIRAEIISDMDRWDNEDVLVLLGQILKTETESRLIGVAADTLSDIGSDAALEILFDGYASTDNLANRYQILAEIADLESPSVLNFLSETALTASDDETAAIAIEGIADRENNIAVAALEHIYLNTDNPQRRLAVIHGIGEAETLQAVEVLEQILQSGSDPEIVSETVRALGETDLPEAVPVVLQAYRSQQSEAVQRAAIRALRRLDNYPGATDGLLEILEDRLNAQSNPQ